MATIGLSRWSPVRETFKEDAIRLPAHPCVLRELYRFGKSAQHLHIPHIQGESRCLPLSTLLHIVTVAELSLFVFGPQSEVLEWDFMLLLEHVASVCESAGRSLDGVLILDCAIRYLSLFSARGGGVRVLFLHSMASLLLSLSAVEKEAETVGDKIEQKGTKSIGDVLVKHAEEAIRGVAQADGIESINRRCEKSVNSYLKAISEVDTNNFVVHRSHKSFLPFVVRCAKKSVTKLYNHTITSKRVDVPDLRDLVISRYGECCALHISLSYTSGY